MADHSSSVIMERKAISGSGCLGSLYDTHRDRIVEKGNLISKMHVDKSLAIAQCALINGSKNESWNLLQSIGIQDDLRVSLLLNLAPTVGIAASMNYHREINEYTRILYYSYQVKEKQCSEEAGRDVKLSSLMKFQTDVTHAITGICFGIDAIVILQLPSDTAINIKIDCILEKIRGILSTNDNSTLKLSSKEKKILKKITNTTVYSNIHTLTNITNVFDVHQRFYEIRKKSDQYRPVAYSLRPLKWLYPQCNEKHITFCVLSSVVIKNLEQYLLHLRTTKNNLDIFFKENKLNLLSRYLKQHLFDANQKWFDLKQEYNNEIKRLSCLVLDYRNGQSDIAIIEKALNDKKQATLKNHMYELVQKVNDLEAKAQLISDLRQQHFEYCNVIEFEVVKSDDEKAVARKLIKDHQRDRIICSNDTLNKNNSEQLNKLRFNLVGEQKKNANLRLIYADFSYCSYKLQNMMILPPNVNNNKSTSKHKTTSMSEKSYTSVPPLMKQQPSVSAATKVRVSTSPPPSPSSLPTDDIINILLIGETGVGKSTFINAFVNYLTFNSLEQAQSDEPIVLITVSFLITTGDNFEEHIIKFVDFDNSNNEDFDHPGQSVTQYCRSYVFSLPHSNGKKLRIIDTPGFGDTRGIDQDDRNIEHIVQYINNLTHLNAICFLFKPNASRLNIFFRSCFSQLFSLLGPNAQQNIIFCFTNARSTFYTPGDTAPLLKTMLQSLSLSDISFKKANTFCFDNESFRYLVALQNGISFSDEDKHEYEMSWSNSVKESNRLLDYINTKVTVYHMQDGWQTIKHAELEIVLLIRPMLEAMRNILRNLILRENNLEDQSINMCPKPLSNLAVRCLSCKPAPVEVGQFWIIPDPPYESQNDCLDCSCPDNQHIPVYYNLEYEPCNEPSNFEQNDNMLSQLCDASVEFAGFLMYIACSTKDDPFFNGLVQMIIEENDHCSCQEKNEFNLQLAKQLRTIEKNYEQRMSKMKPNKENIDLLGIYNLINTIKEYPMVREQMMAIKQTQNTMMEQNEYEVQRFNHYIQ